MKSPFGVSVTAADGHHCRSLFEKAVDDFFHSHGIAHVDEPSYPWDAALNRNGMRADWKLPDSTFVQALGLQSREDYAAKTLRKQQLAND